MDEAWRTGAGEGKTIGSVFSEFDDFMKDLGNAAARSFLGFNTRFLEYVSEAEADARICAVKQVERPVFEVVPEFYQQFSLSWVLFRVCLDAVCHPVCCILW